MPMISIYVDTYGGKEEVAMLGQAKAHQLQGKRRRSSRIRRNQVSCV